MNKKNIVLFLCDDLGPGDLSTNGNPYTHTPHLDNLARNSHNFSQFTVNPVCSASRASLLTGKNFLKVGVEHVHGGKEFIHPNEKLLPEYLKDAGYTTGMWGKWHNGMAEGYYPWQRGFDEVSCLKLYQHREAKSYNSKTASWEDHQVFGDEHIVDRAMQFIDKNQARPFFAYLPSMTPHSPHDASEEYVDAHMQKGLSRALATLYAMVDFLDVQVGRLINHLKTSGLWDNTVFLFLSDNGPNRDAHLQEEERQSRNALGLHGWKGDIWEGGVRSPLLIHYPGGMSASCQQQICQMTDLFYTLKDEAGLGEQKEEDEGQSLLPLLEKNEELHTKAIFNYSNPGWPPSEKPYSPLGIRDEYRPVSASEKLSLICENQVLSLRQGKYKLLLNPDINLGGAESNDWQLYDLEKDSAEKNNIIEEGLPEIPLMKERLKQWFNGVKSSPHSYHRPVIRLSDKNTTIKSAWASNMSDGLKNTAHDIRSWKNQGDYADYALVLAPELKWKINLVWDDSLEEAPEVDLFALNRQGEIKELEDHILSTNATYLRVVVKTHLQKSRILQSLLFEPL